MCIRSMKVLVLSGILIFCCGVNNFAFAGGHGHGHGGHGHGGFHVGFVIAPPVSPVFICPPPRVYYPEPAVVVVPPPPVVAAPTTTVVAPEQTVTVWISNDNGSKSSVVLKKENEGPGYIGPKGEYYSSMPTEEQLRVLYGIQTGKSEKKNFTVWLKNDNGSMTPVVLNCKDGGYVGPSGEFYPNMPTESQLRSLYSPKSVVADANNVTVWIENGDGTKTAVELIKEGSEFIGPNGEHYQSMPTMEQLKMVYSQKSNKTEQNGKTVWIQNSDGTKMPITLQKEGSGYTGPAGEKYSSMPTEEQLKLLYGSGTKTSDQNELSFEITKKDGTKTIINFKKDGTDFVGPKGEHYQKIPTEDQLRMIYG